MICPLSVVARYHGTSRRRHGVLAGRLEQAMRMQDVILRALSGEIRWFQAAGGIRLPHLYRSTRVRTQHTIYAWARIDADGVEHTLSDHVSQHGIGGRYNSFARTLMDALTVVAVPAAARERRAQLFERLVRDQISRGKEVLPLIESWIAFDRAAASRFLTQEWSIDGLDQRYKFTLIYSLIKLASKPLSPLLHDCVQSGRRTRLRDYLARGVLLAPRT